MSLWEQRLGCSFYAAVKYSVQFFGPHFIVFKSCQHTASTMSSLYCTMETAFYVYRALQWVRQTDQANAVEYGLCNCCFRALRLISRICLVSIFRNCKRPFTHALRVAALILVFITSAAHSAQECVNGPWETLCTVVLLYVYLCRCCL